MLGAVDVNGGVVDNSTTSANPPPTHPHNPAISAKPRSPAIDNPTKSTHTHDQTTINQSHDPNQTTEFDIKPTANPDEQNPIVNPKIAQAQTQTTMSLRQSYHVTRGTHATGTPSQNGTQSGTLSGTLSGTQSTINNTETLKSTLSDAGTSTAADTHESRKKHAKKSRHKTKEKRVNFDGKHGATKMADASTEADDRVPLKQMNNDVRFPPIFTQQAWGPADPRSTENRPPSFPPLSQFVPPPAPFGQYSAVPNETDYYNRFGIPLLHVTRQATTFQPSFPPGYFAPPVRPQSAAPYQSAAPDLSAAPQSSAPPYFGHPSAGPPPLLDPRAVLQKHLEDFARSQREARGQDGLERFGSQRLHMEKQRAQTEPQTTKMESSKNEIKRFVTYI